MSENEEGRHTDKKIRIKYPIVVEGKYDKNTLLQIFDATVICLDGFGVFNSKDKQALIRRLGEDGLILLTDSDGAGGVIRSFVKGIIPKEKLYNVYIPRIKGKEKRKKEPSREGYLGVEGMKRKELVRILSQFTNDGGRDKEISDLCKEKITKTHLFADGLTGCTDAALARDAVCRYFMLPEGMNAGALLDALNVVTDLEGYRAAVRSLKGGE